MSYPSPAVHKSRYSHHPSQPQAGATPPTSTSIAIDENELATRWKLSVKTLRRWRQTALGPVFCKFGSRVVYLRTEIEAFERQVSRNATYERAYQ